MDRPSVPESYFAEMYCGAADPWHLAERWYEQRKYAITLASLPLRHYRRVFEPGCSVGVLSEQLAPRCDRLLSWDRRPEAVDAAARRLEAFEGAEARHGVVPEQWPDGEFDLIVLSEMLYYLDAEERSWLLHAAIRSLADGGHLLAVHWRHHVPEHTAEADEIHDELRKEPELLSLARHEEDDFLLDVLARVHREDVDSGRGRHLGRSTEDERPRAVSVAALEGLV